MRWSHALLVSFLVGPLAGSCTSASRSSDPPDDVEVDADVTPVKKDAAAKDTRPPSTTPDAPDSTEDAKRDPEDVAVVSGSDAPTDRPSATTDATVTPSDAAPSGSVVILSVGDISGSGGSQAKTATLVKTLMQSKAVLGILTLGDHAYDSNTTAEFTKYFTPTWGVPEIMALIHPAPGNHEYQTTNAKGYFDYFNGAGNATGKAGDRTKGYYSFDLGNWHFLSLNSNDECGVVACDAGSAQVAWIKAELEQNKTRCTLAYMHHPRFNEGISHADVTAMKDVWNALYDGGADVALAGHEHDFQQFAPMDKTGKVDKAKGVRSWVVGSGGIDHYSGFNTSHKDAEEFKNETEFGVLEMTLSAGSYEWRFVTTAGTALVSGKDVCHN